MLVFFLEIDEQTRLDIMFKVHYTRKQRSKDVAGFEISQNITKKLQYFLGCMNVVYSSMRPGRRETAQISSMYTISGSAAYRFV